MTRFDAVIFDMDGVLIDSEPLHFGVLSKLFTEHGHTYNHAENEEFIGTTTHTMFSTLIARYGLRGSVAEFEAQYNAAILRVLQQPHEPSAGVVSLVQHLRRLGVAPTRRRADSLSGDRGLAQRRRVRPRGGHDRSRRAHPPTPPT